MCEFCKNFNFGEASAKTEHGLAHIHLAGGSYRFPEHEQFNFCPVCGERRLTVQRRKHPNRWHDSEVRQYVLTQ